MILEHHFEEGNVPYIVAPQPNRRPYQQHEWRIAVAKDGATAIEVYDSKPEALAKAKQMAKSVGRAGVVSFKVDGSYQRFIPNDEWWANAAGGSKQ